MKSGSKKAAWDTLISVFYPEKGSNRTKTSKIKMINQQQKEKVNNNHDNKVGNNI